MTYNAIRGMMGATKDRYTRFLDPKGYKEMQEENNDEFVGIGALLGTNPAKQVYVVTPPAELPGHQGQCHGRRHHPEGQQHVHAEAA